MGAVVHPHVCTVDIPYHTPGEKATDDILLISYHNQGDVRPCRGLGKQPAATVLGVPPENPIDQSADNTPPNLCVDLGNKSERQLSVSDVFAAPTCDPGHQSAGHAEITPHYSPEDQSAVENPVVPFVGTSIQAAEDDTLTRSLTPGGPVAEPIVVTPQDDSEDKSAEVTSYHDLGHQLVDDTPLILDHHLKEKPSEVKPAGGNLKVSHQNLVDQPSDEALVIPAHETENSPANEVLQIWGSVSEKQPTDDGRLVLSHDLEPQTPDKALKTSDHFSEVNSRKDFLTTLERNSGDKPSEDATLPSDHETEHNSESDALLAAKDEIGKTYAGETLIESLDDSKHKIADDVLISDRLENTSAEHAFAVSNHELENQEEDEGLLAKNKTLESNHPSDAVAHSYASEHKHTDELVLGSNHVSGKQRSDDVHLALSNRPEVRPVDNVLLASSHNSGDQSAGESVVISYHDSEVQPTGDALLIISNELNHQPANGAILALSKELNDQPEDDLLVVSPYAFAPHLLRLNTVSKPNQLLAKALTQMRAVRDDYATAAYIESFNWSTIVDHVKNLAEKAAYEWQPEVFYIVVFRSRVREVTDRVDLGMMDAKAHEEAMQSGGLLKYWFGVPDANCRNLATCKFWPKTLRYERPLIHLGIWRDQDDAKRGGRGEGHQRAMRAIAGLYTEWKLERLRFVIEPGEHGDLKWDISDW